MLTSSKTLWLEPGGNYEVVRDLKGNIIGFRLIDKLPADYQLPTENEDDHC